MNSRKQNIITVHPSKEPEIGRWVMGYARCP